MDLYPDLKYKYYSKISKKIGKKIVAKYTSL